MELLEAEPEVEKFCRQDPVLRFIAFNAHITGGLECVKRIVACPEGRQGSRDLFTELQKLNNVTLPSQLEKLISSTQNTCVNEQLLGSLIHNRVQKIAKLEMLNSKLLYQKVEVSPTNAQQPQVAKPGAFGSTPHRHSIDGSTIFRESLGSTLAGEDDNIVSAFDPLCDSTNTYQSPAALQSLQKEDLIWFSPSTRPAESRKTKATEPLSARTSSRKPPKRAKSAEDMISF